jgi:hypothetical protein
MSVYVVWFLSTLAVSYGLLCAADSQVRGVRFGARLAVLVFAGLGVLSGIIAFLFLVLGMVR